MATDREQVNSGGTVTNVPSPSHISISYQCCEKLDRLQSALKQFAQANIDDKETLRALQRLARCALDKSLMGPLFY